MLLAVLCLALGLLDHLASAVPQGYAIITGASSGIGRALALESASHGYNVVLAARREDMLLTLQEEIKEKHKVDAIVSVVDLEQTEGVMKLRKDTANLDVQVLVANAGFAWSGQMTDQPFLNLASMVSLNMQSTAHLASLYGFDFAARGSGKIMLTSSLTALSGLPGASLYAATRGFVRQLAAGLRDELRPSGVTVTTLLPGATDTEFAAKTNIQDSLIFNFPGSRLLGLTLSSEVVAEYALVGLRDGVAEVIPGFMNRLYAMSAENLMPKWMSSRYATYTFCEPNPLLDVKRAGPAVVVMLLGVCLMVLCIPAVCLSYVSGPVGAGIVLAVLILVNIYQNGKEDTKAPKITSLNDVRVLNKKCDVIAAWRAGAAPTPSQLKKLVSIREFDAELISLGALRHASWFITHVLFGMGRRWVGKSFKKGGTGANRFSGGASLAPYTWEVGKSRFDGADCLVLSYADAGTVPWGYPVGMRDELRVVRDWDDEKGLLMIGLGGLALTGGMRNGAVFVVRGGA